MGKIISCTYKYFFSEKLNWTNGENVEIYLNILKKDSLCVLHTRKLYNLAKIKKRKDSYMCSKIKLVELIVYEIGWDLGLIIRTVNFGIKNS